MLSTRRWSVVVLVPAMLLGSAACGGSTFKADPAADLAVAKGAVLTNADVPGYTGKPHTDSDDTPLAAKKQFAACLHAPSTIFDDKPNGQKADSPDFTKGVSQITNSVEIDPTTSDIDKGWSQISQQGIEPCLKDFFASALKAAAKDTPGATFDTNDVTRFDVGVGNRSVGYTLKVVVGVRGVQIPFFVDLIFVARDRAGIDLFFLGVRTPIDRTFETSLAEKVYDRVGNKT